jgi:hypothetical protein
MQVNFHSNAMHYYENNIFMFMIIRSFLIT